MKKFLTILFIIAFLPIIAFSQKEYNNWFFGNQSGFTFNDIENGLPRVFAEDEFNQNFKESGFSSPLSVSDKDGNLLFYSDSKNIYNRKHQVMPNGFIAVLEKEAWNSLTSIPSQKNKKQHYLFYLKSFKHKTENRLVYYLCCSIIDMSFDQGYGDVIVKDSVIYTYYDNVIKDEFWVSKIQNGYVFYHVWDNEIRRLQYSNGKFTILEPYTVKAWDLDQIIGVSPDGTMLVIDANFTTLILKLNPVNGEIMNEIDTEMYNTYTVNILSVGFSPDCSKLYACHSFSIGNYLFQYDIKSKTKIQISDVDTYQSALQLGPDGKIYYGGFYDFDGGTEDTRRYISVIHNPNELGTACNFELNAIDLGELGKFNTRFPRYNGFGLAFNASTNTPICGGGNIELNAYTPMFAGEDCTFEWTGPKGFISTEQNPVIYNVNSTHSGKYTLNVNKGQFIKTLDVEVENLPKARISPAKDTVLCDGKTLRLRAFPRETGETYLWSTGDTTHQIYVSQTGQYILTAENEIGCTVSDTINVLFVTPDAAKIEAPLRICKGGSAVLRAVPESPDYRYLWSTGETTSSISVSTEGTYKVTIFFLPDCSAEASVYLQYASLPTAEILSDRPLCEGIGIKLSSSDQRTGYKYLWSTGETTAEITTAAIGEYKLIVENSFGCRDSAVIQVGEKPNAEIEIVGNKCLENNVILKVKYPSSKNTYRWSTGETSEQITVSSAGRYILYAENSDGCKDSSEIEIFARPVPQIIGTSRICPFATAKLSADKDYTGYLWSTGETTKEIEIGTAGKYSLTITDANGCEGTAEFDVEMIDIDLEYEKTISFNTATYKNYDLNINIKNSGNENIIIKNISVNNPKFTLKNSITELNAGKTKTLELGFTSTEIGTFTAELLIEIESPCAETHTIFITANVEQGLSAKVWLTKMEVIPGDSVTIPLYASFSEDMDASLNYTANILIKRDILWLEAPSIADRHSITLSGEAQVSMQEQIIGEIKSVALLGKSPSETVIASIVWSKPGIETEKENGELTITGVCSPELRDVQFVTNPMFWTETQSFGNTIEFRYANLPEDEYTISIYSILGEQKMNTTNKLRGNGKLNLNVQNITQGNYLYVITRTGTSVSSGSVLIIR